MIYKLLKVVLVRPFACFLCCLVLITACQPKAGITTIDHPMNAVNTAWNDSLHGAANLQDLAGFLYLSLKDEITPEQLSVMFPDSGDVAQIYDLTGTAKQGANMKAIADSARSMLSKGWKKTKHEAVELKVNWTDAEFVQLMIQDIENQKLPTKKIMLECKSGTQTLRASARCLQIGDRWFIGEDIKFGV